MASAEVFLPILEERFPVLLARALRSSDFASVYQFQSLIVLLEIEQFDTRTAEDNFLHLEEEEEQAAMAGELVSRMESWRRRLEYACLEDEPIGLLRDLSGQISMNISPSFVAFIEYYDVYIGAYSRLIWCGANQSMHDTKAADFLHRFYLLLLASIQLLKDKREVYREEIYSFGKMDPSLAVIVAFLNNYREIAGEFNKRWKSLPMFYLNEILKAVPRKEKAGSTWFSFEKTPAGGEVRIPKNTYIELPSDGQVAGFKLNEDIQLTRMSAVKIEKIIQEKNAERYPEAAMNYTTAIVKSTLPDNRYSPAQVGVRLYSSMLYLSEGVREVNVYFHLTDDSLVTFCEVVQRIAAIQKISTDEAQFKILYDAFHLYVSTREGGRQVENFQLRLRKDFGLQLTFRLGEDFPDIEPLTGETLPSLRLQINPSAWLYPYSWARRIFIKSIRIHVSVTGIQNILVYNDLGMVDVCQPFYPFGISAGKGAWMAFGNYEMACKPVDAVKLSFNWQQLPACRGGMKEHYRHYKQEIDNTSFTGRLDQLNNRKWRTLDTNAPIYLFRTSDEDVPQKEDMFVERMVISFRIFDPVQLPYGQVETYRLGEVRSGFYRLSLASPEMGFGHDFYRRLFAETMIWNARTKRQEPLPKEPVSPLMEALHLAYTASEEYYFNVGYASDMKVLYIRPLAEDIDSCPDYSRPIPLLEGPVDEGNLMIGIADAVGENLLRMYLDIELLQREIDHDYLPSLDWSYRDASKWVQMETVNVLRDDTGGLMRSGAVILQFPFCISHEMTDSEGLFWICAGVHTNLCNTSKVRGVFLNVVEVEPTDIQEMKISLPGVSSFCQIAPLNGDCSAESEAEIRTRMRERIAGRNRLLLPQEYEQMTLQKFPEITKVKCLPGIDPKQQKRKNMVTLVTVGVRTPDEYPLCTDELLCRVEQLLRQYASPFVNIDAINPVYEEVTVFCGLSLKSGEAAGTSIQEVYENIRKCIAPWDEKKEAPVFGYFFSLRDLLSRIKVSGRIEAVHGIKLIQMIYNKNGLQYSLREYLLQDGGEQVIAPSVPWAVLVPAQRQYVKVVTADEWRGDIEFGDLEVENTFAIK